MDKAILNTEDLLAEVERLRAIEAAARELVDQQDKLLASYEVLLAEYSELFQKQEALERLFTPNRFTEGHDAIVRLFKQEAPDA